LDRYRVSPGTKVDLAKHDPDDISEFPELNKTSSRDVLTELNARLGELQAQLAACADHKVLVVFQAMDTGGKDGAIRSVFHGVNPQGVKVTSFKAPNETERAHDYLWRIHHNAPLDGQISIFNRSHYEDVLIVRVHSLVPKSQWRKRYDHIVAFEQQLADEGTTVLKFFLHISKDEQRKRLQARLDNPEKHWKFNTADLDERKHWDDYQEAYAEAIERTSTKVAPWWVVPSNPKWYRNLVVSKVIVDALEGLKMRWPEPEPGLDELVVE
jgi:PPK2 family polyphosphate:nucleotide phosphotransferase